MTQELTPADLDRLTKLLADADGGPISRRLAVNALLDAAPALIAAAQPIPPPSPNPVAPTDARANETIAGRLVEWTHEHGANLCPGYGIADTFGEGMRAAKEQVGRIIANWRTPQIAPASDEPLRKAAQMPYRSRCIEQAVGHLIEECGEVCAAAGKSIRWGLDSTDPTIPELERESNGAWVLRELLDLDRAIAAVRKLMPDRFEIERADRANQDAGGQRELT